MITGCEELANSSVPGVDAYSFDAMKAEETGIHGEITTLPTSNSVKSQPKARPVPSLANLPVYPRLSPSAPRPTNYLRVSPRLQAHLPHPRFPKIHFFPPGHVLFPRRFPRIYIHEATTLSPRLALCLT